MLTPDELEVYRTYASDGVLALQEIEDCLLTLEAAPRAMTEINRLYRALHTLKGNSALLGMTRIENVAHAAEDMVGLVRDRNVAFGAELVELMLRCTDRLRGCVARVGDEQCDAGEGVLDDLREEIAGWIRAHGGTMRSVPSAARGDFVLFTSVPPPPPSQRALGDDGVLALERVLGCARELLLVVHAPVAHEQAVDGSEALGLACVDAHETALADCAARVAELCRQPRWDRPALHAALLLLTRQLAELDSRRLAATGIPDEFGLAELSARALASFASAPQAEPPRREHAVPPAPRTHEANESKSDYLRIDAAKLSLVMELAGEIALACGAVTHFPGLADIMPEGFVTASQKLELLIRELQNEVSAMRLVPVSGVFQRMRRVVRDTCQRTGKKVELELLGEETEIDKVMVDALHDPLVHLVRNAIDHGIEAPAERLAAGKPEVGRLVLEAMHQGGEVSVQIRDDGRGMSRQRIRARAEQRGLIPAGTELSDAQTLELLFLPGFSTKDAIDELSGRGVGMDVIRTTVQSLRGQVKLESREGHGSTVNMTLPLTLAFVEAMVVRERDQLFAFPIEKVIEVFKPEPGQVVESSADGRLALRLRERLIPVLWLHRYFGDTRAVNERIGDRVIVVAQTARGELAVPVESLLGNQPIMLKPLRGVLARVRAAAGCGMLRTGDVALALDCDGLHV